MSYRYRLKSLGDSSARYGNCECCRKLVSEVFIQTEEKSFSLDVLDDPAIRAVHPDGVGWSMGLSLFGHEACLMKARKELAL